MIVVAVALIASDGRVLMQRRPAHARHGGLWEFPGGKVEPGEGLAAAAVREIDEELGITLAREALVPVTFAEGAGGEGPGIMLALFAARDWAGAPQCRAASALGWFAPGDIAALAMPPLDVPLARALAWAIGTPQVPLGWREVSSGSGI